MKRDLSVVRAILLRCESAPAGIYPEIGSLDDLCEDHAALIEHIGLMAEAGLLNVIDTTTHDGEDYIINRMTWAGHEFLDSVRDDSVWLKAKKHVLKPGASWTFEILKEWAKYEVKQRLGMPS